MSRLTTGGLIDRTRPIDFTFDGHRYSGFAGDTLASALIANGVKLVGRSFKYHRPRGILTAGPEEPNALVTLHSGAKMEPNSRATTTELFDGLEASSQNRWPSLEFDLLAMNQLAAPIFVAGFYYKTFMWPARFWEKLYEPLIRRAAGLGKLSMLPDPDSYDREHGFCDLLVIGAGPAGIAAALTAGRAGLRVILAEQDIRPGGRLLAERHEIDGLSGPDWVDGAIEELRSLPNVRLLTRTCVFGLFDGNEYGAVERLADHLPHPAANQPRQRLWKIVARHAILAAGAIERPLVFGGNDRPGVMMASAVSTYLNRHAAVPGKRAVVFTSTDSGWSTARDLLNAGVEVAAIVDARPDCREFAHDLQAQGVKFNPSSTVSQVRGRTVKGVEIVDGQGRRQTIACDLLAMSGGWNPDIGIGTHLGAKPTWCETIHSFRLDCPPAGLSLAGSAAGLFSLSAALIDGETKARQIAEAFGHSTRPSAWKASDEPTGLFPLWQVPKRKGKAFVDFQNDVTDTDVALAAQEGFVSVEHLKRYTTLGMATDQGKAGQVNGQALLALATGKALSEAGTIRPRPPHHPVSIGVMAGHHRGRYFRPERHTASRDWASEMGAIFTDAGMWKRVQYFPLQSETNWLDSVNREVTATRNGVGICDVSTLGKIDIHGPDAGMLLDRLYINMFSTLSVGKARYGVMLREDGFVMDDGTTSRLSEDRFFMTTTTANAARVMQHVDFARQVLWPELDVQAVSVTDQWATYSVAGPDSRALLQKAFPDLDLSNASFPYMAAMEFRWGMTNARIFRLSFSGELAYEVSVQADQGERLIRHLFEAGREFSAVPYGTEALGVMRIEKGHPAGNELSGQTTAGDLGMGRMMSQKKDFIGRVMAQRAGLTDPARPALVGLKPIDPSHRLRAGAHLLAPGAAPIAANDEGYVTSAAWSPTLGHAIALGLLVNGRDRYGQRIILHDPLRGADVEAEICDPVFVDPEGVRVRG